MKIATLTCERDLQVALHCLSSLRRYCTDLETLTIYEDGSLSEAGFEALEQKLPGAEIVRRKSIDERVEASLARHPSCLSFRRENPLALKLIDIPFLAPPDILFVDCDIRFFRPFECSGIAALQSTHFIFAVDPSQGYSGRLLDLILKHRLAIPGNVNTGMWSAPRVFYNLDFIEWFLSVPEFRTLPTLVEQTCWAALAGSNPGQLLDPRQVHCASGPPVVDGETVAVHFIAHHKNLVAGCRDLPAEDIAGGARALRLGPATRLNLRSALGHSLGRRWRRLIG